MPRGNDRRTTAMTTDEGLPLKPFSSCFTEVSGRPSPASALAQLLADYLNSISGASAGGRPRPDVEPLDAAPREQVNSIRSHDHQAMSRDGRAEDLEMASMKGKPQSEVSDLCENQLPPSLDGVRFPACKWELLSCAEYNGAGLPVRLALWQLPERRYLDLAEVAITISQSQYEDSPESTRVPCSPPATRRGRSARSVKVVECKTSRKRTR